MTTLEALDFEMRLALRNTLRNLEHLPDDKLNWKPAPGAKSATEIVNHVAGQIRGVGQILRADESPTPFVPATNREEIKALLSQSVENYLSKLQTIRAERMEEVVALPFGEAPLSVVRMLPIFDLMHHNGQVAFIQTLLGDEEEHFTL